MQLLLPGKWMAGNRWAGTMGPGKNLVMVNTSTAFVNTATASGNTATASDPLADLISKKKFSPVLRQVSGNPLWAARIRLYEEGPSIHFLNRGLIAIPHATLKDSS